jgi:glycosyltransferase involved in cell wall biosynthesis
LEIALGKNKLKKKILLLTDHFNATYYLAFHYALKSLVERGKLDFVVLSQQDIVEKAAKENPPTFAEKLLESEKADLVILNRYGFPYGRYILEECKKNKIETIYFIDDDLLNIPVTLGKEIQKQHGDREIIAERKFLLENVDLIWVSTQYLSNKISQYLPNKQIIHGGYPPYLESLINKTKFKQKSEKFKFGYMGSKGHKQDLERIVPAISKILNNYPQTEFETFGTISLPEELKKFGDRALERKVIPQYDRFLQQLYDLDWNLGLNPLEDTEFNLCKSPIKYLEYTACDIPTIASDNIVYNQIIDSNNGILTEGDYWDKNIELILHNPELGQKVVKNAQETCRQKFDLTKVEEQILNIIDRCN